MNNKPFLVKVAVLYFALTSLLITVFSLFLVIKSNEPISVLFFIILVPDLIGFIILLGNPKPWHHTYCSIVGNITGFSGLIGFFIDVIFDQTIIAALPKLLVAILTIFIFLSFDFNKKVRKYYKK